MSLELSPGFFDPNIALSDEEEEDIVPKNIHIEPRQKENVIVSFVRFMVLNVKPDCKCNDGWQRTWTY